MKHDFYCCSLKQTSVITLPLTLPQGKRFNWFFFLENQSQISCFILVYNKTEPIYSQSDAEDLRLVQDRKNA